MDKTLAKALRILELLARSDRPQGVTELASALALSKSSVHRPLSALVELGYVRREDDTGHYSASLKMWEVGSAVLERLDLKRIAAGPMAELSAATGETVHLSIPDGCDVVHIDKIECKHPIRAYSRVGGRVPLHCIATGKAILAFQSDAFINAATSSLRRATPNTVVDRSRLLAELAQIRQTGIATSRGAWEVGVDGIAAPIHDATGHVVAGVGISGPAIRLRLKECAGYSALVASAATKISRFLGYKGNLRRPRAARMSRSSQDSLENRSGAELPDGPSRHRQY